MRLTVLALALASLVASPARASDEVTAFGISATIAYDEKCEVLPRALKDTALLAMETVPADTLRTAMQKVLTFYNNAGPAKFCAATKPVVERVMMNAKRD